VTVSRVRVVENGLRCRCPNCGGRRLFQEGRLFRVNPSCPDCGLKIENGDGAFLGPFVINYAVTAFGVVIPIVVLYALGKIGAVATLSLAFAAAMIVPLLLYRLSWGWWLMVYYFFLPENLPANLGTDLPDDE